MRVYTTRSGDTVHLVKGCNGAHNEKRICSTCGDGFFSQERIYGMEQDPSEKTFEQYLKHPKKTPPHVTIRRKEQLLFSDNAIDLVDFDFNYVKAYISDDALMVGLMPVSGGEVDDQTLSAKGYNVSFTGIATELNVEFGERDERYEVEWSEEREMYIVDFSGKQV